MDFYLQNVSFLGSSVGWFFIFWSIISNQKVPSEGTKWLRKGFMGTKKKAAGGGGDTPDHPLYPKWVFFIRWRVSWFYISILSKRRLLRKGWSGFVGYPQIFVQGRLDLQYVTQWSNIYCLWFCVLCPHFCSLPSPPPRDQRPLPAFWPSRRPVPGRLHAEDQQLRRVNDGAFPPVTPNPTFSLSNSTQTRKATQSFPQEVLYQHTYIVFIFLFIGSNKKISVIRTEPPIDVKHIWNGVGN